MNIANYIVFDFETDGLNTDTCQPLQLASVVLDPRSLKPYDGSKFSTYIRPDFDTLDTTALETNKITLDDLKDAPPLKVVWKQFAKYCQQYDAIIDKTKKKPVPVGHNIQGYDLLIVRRLNKQLKQPDFFNMFSVDTLSMAYSWFESSYEVESLKLDTMRKLIGLDTSKSHNAIVDVQHNAEIFKHFMELHRKVGQYVKWSI